MTDSNTAALNRHMAEQDESDRAVELYGERAREELEGKAGFADMLDIIADDLHEALGETGLLHLLKWFAGYDSDGHKAWREAFDYAAKRLVTDEAVRERAQEIMRQEKTS